MIDDLACIISDKFKCLKCVSVDKYGQSFTINITGNQCLIFYLRIIIYFRLDNVWLDAYAYSGISCKFNFIINYDEFNDADEFVGLVLNKVLYGTMLPKFFHD